MCACCLPPPPSTGQYLYLLPGSDLDRNKADGVLLGKGAWPWTCLGPRSLRPSYIALALHTDGERLPVGLGHFHAQLQALRPAAPVISCWTEANNSFTDVDDVHLYNSDFQTWNAEVFSSCTPGATDPSRCEKGAVVTEGGARWGYGLAADAGSPLTVVNYLSSLTGAVGIWRPFVPGVMLAWELMVGTLVRSAVGCFLLMHLCDATDGVLPVPTKPFLCFAAPIDTATVIESTAAVTAGPKRQCVSEAFLGC